MDIFGDELDATALARLTGDPAAVAGIQQVTLHEGVQEGVRAIQVRTAAGLEFSVNVDRALDLADARFAGMPFGWRSGVGYRHPGLDEHHDENGLSWLRMFDGLLGTAGLDHTLFGADVDADTYHYPPKTKVSHRLHGRVASIPARLLECSGDAETGVFRIKGDVTQAVVFGERLRLTRTIEADFDGSEIRLHDQVTNLGFDRTPHMFLYHINFGWPLVAEGTQFFSSSRGKVWQSDSCAEQGASFETLPGPTDTFVEQVCEHDLSAGSDGLHRVALIRPDDRLGIELSWESKTMPYFFQWMHLRTGQYAIGLEPSTHHVTGNAAAREDGSMIWLEHGEARSYRTTIRPFSGTAAADEVRDRIGGAR